MNAFYAGSLGIAAALAGSLADPTAALAADPVAPEPMDPSAVEAKAERSDPDPLHAGPVLDAAEAGPACEAKCKVLALTERTLPGLGASQLLGVLLYPEERGVSINTSDGTPALTFTVMPTKLTRGRGLVAIARF